VAFCFLSLCAPLPVPAAFGRPACPPPVFTRQHEAHTRRAAPVAHRARTFSLPRRNKRAPWPASPRQARALACLAATSARVRRDFTRRHEAHARRAAILHRAHSLVCPAVENRAHVRPPTRGLPHAPS